MKNRAKHVIDVFVPKCFAHGSSHLASRLSAKLVAGIKVTRGLPFCEFIRFRWQAILDNGFHVVVRVSRHYFGSRGHERHEVRANTRHEVRARATWGHHARIVIRTSRIRLSSSLLHRVFTYARLAWHCAVVYAYLYSANSCARAYI